MPTAVALIGVVPALEATAWGVIVTGPAMLVSMGMAFIVIAILL